MELTNACRQCGRVDSFKRERNYFEREHLVVDEDGSFDIDNSDMEGPVDEWTYECYYCGATASDLEDLLAEKEEEEDDF